MSITFTAQREGHAVSIGSALEPCSCTQADRAFDRAMDLVAMAGSAVVFSAELAGKLCGAASPACRICKGCGMVTYPLSLDVNFANASAAALWRYLQGPGSYQMGDAPLALLRMLTAPLLSQLATLELPAPDAPEIEYERRRGAMGARVLEGQITADGLAARLARFGAFLAAADAAGADSVSWG